MVAAVVERPPFNCVIAGDISPARHRDIAQRIDIELRADWPNCAGRDRFRADGDVVRFPHRRTCMAVDTDQR